MQKWRAMASCVHNEISGRHSDDTMDDENDEKDSTKRKSRNLSEKKRRDQFNLLVNELGSMVNTNTRKMDKSTVLKSTILFLKNHNDIAARSRVHEIQEDWKPSFLSNEEFTHLILEALDGFIIVFSSSGRIYYTSESITSLLGYLPSELTNSTIYEVAYQDDQSHLYNVLLSPKNTRDHRNNKKDNQISFTCHIKRGGIEYSEEPIYELVQFIGYFRSDMDLDIESIIPTNQFSNNSGGDRKTESMVFFGTGRLQTPQLIQEMSVVDSSKSEFSSRHSLEWKFLFLDHRAPPIIGYLPFEVLGTSGYDYYHIDDLDKVVTCHESLMQKGEGTSCYYRFLTKGQQWIWLQTRFYITYNQWNSKPEFIVCTHRVLSYVDVIKQMRKNADEQVKVQNQNDVLSSSKPQIQTSTSCQIRPDSWSSKRSKAGKKFSKQATTRCLGEESDTTTISARSQYPQANNKLPIQRVDTRNCGPPASLPSPLPSHEALQQQAMVMSPAQNHIQDELQRKHEELQQLIVHQQEELRRVSEQLLIARYGIFSPNLNVNIPNSTNSNLPQNPIISSASPRITPPGVNLVPAPVPISLPVPINPIELFNQHVAVNPVSRGISMTELENMDPMLPQSQNHQLHQLQTHQELPQHRHHVQQSGSHPHPQPEENQNLMNYQICQSDELVYTNMSSNTNH
ncbi:circadian locomoter output cycles protein kaput [Belonocnema kinseyi]|uniref:circadian locomoter output cycles protein kaput n=1 Tax=Belonocnema kinseyi TaxID=2817044 RepID=UPI00143D7412|nr:circadian locomoter output cycles protein kaput [Belonocnema kinseyi]